MPNPKIKRWADSIEVRNWATELSDKERKDLGIEGIEVSKRGRFHSDLVRAFNRVHRDQGVRYVPIARNQPRLAEVFEEADREDDRPTVTRQPRQEKAKEQEAPEAPAVPPTPLPVPAVAAQPTVLAFPAAPEQVMDMLRQGATVIVAYVALPVQVAV